MRLKKFVYKRVLSTNNVAIRKINKGIQKGIIISDTQTKGRGRYSKKWISIKGNLFTTIFYEITKFKNLKKLTRFDSRLVIRCLNKFIKKKIYFKFPNDLLIENCKICGILQEIITKNKKKYVIVGIGINIVESPVLKDYKTSYLNKFLKNRTNKDRVFNNLKIIFEKNLKNI